jgi:hypothetical protein
LRRPGGIAKAPATPEVSCVRPKRSLQSHSRHLESQAGALQQAVDETGSNGLLLSHANLIDAVSPKFINTNTIKVGLNLDQQALAVA